VAKASPSKATAIVRGIVAMPSLESGSSTIYTLIFPVLAFFKSGEPQVECINAAGARQQMLAPAQPIVPAITYSVPGPRPLG